MRKQQKMKKSGLKSGEKVMMHSCYEARKPQYANKVRTTCSEPWDLCGSEVIKLEGFSGGFATEFLKRVKVEEQIHVFQVCECDAVAAYTLDEALEWYTKQPGLEGDELYAYDDIEVVSMDKQVMDDGEGMLISVQEIVNRYWNGKPFIAVTTEF